MTGGYLRNRNAISKRPEMIYQYLTYQNLFDDYTKVDQTSEVFCMHKELDCKSLEMHEG